MAMLWRETTKQKNAGVKYLIMALVLALASCATSVPVVGQFTGAKDDFMGSATSTLSKGTMQLQSQEGLTCDGTLTRPTLASGTGSIRCSDGRTGTFVFTKNNYNGGTGFGALSDGEKFRFSFGNQVRQMSVHCEQGSDSSKCTETSY
jgi:hypothetical protein